MSRLFVDELVAREAAFWEAAGNGEFYREAFTDEGLMVLPFASGVFDKETSIASVDAASPWERFSIEEPRVIELGEGVAALVYRAEGIRSGSAPYRALISSVYVFRDGAWRLALHQQTPIDG